MPIGPRLRFLTVAQSAALSVTALATAAVIAGVAAEDPTPQTVLGRLTPPDLPPETHVLSLFVGLTLLGLAPRLWRGTRTAAALTIAGLIALAALNAGGRRFGEAGVEVGLALLLGLGRGAFRLGCSNRPRPAIVCAAVGAWGLAWCALLFAPAVRRTAGHVIARLLHHSSAHVATAQPQLSANWISLIEALTGCAVLISMLALRSLLRPNPAVNHAGEHEHRLARAIVERYGEDSLSPFLVRPDKALAFAAGGVLSYRVIGGTAIVSSDPVGPPDAPPQVLESFLDLARQQGWRVALWAASGRHLDAYRQLGLRAIRVGEEAFVDPRAFSLAGRRVRKLRQSTHRVARRGWEISVHEGREIDGELESEIDALEGKWRAAHPRLHGFAMSRGSFPAGPRPDDLYVLGRSPDGALGAVMRFIPHCRNLSLDTMHRVGDTPNGLNEALVVRALEVAAERGVAEVSLNYAGLAHLVREEPCHNRAVRILTRLAITPLHRRFQMDRLVRFNEKFSPEWRPRYLVYESRGGLAPAIVRVLQAEGYLPERRRLGFPRSRQALGRSLPARIRPRSPISEPR